MSSVRLRDFQRASFAGRIPPPCIPALHPNSEGDSFPGGQPGFLFPLSSLQGQAGGGRGEWSPILKEAT